MSLLDIFSISYDVMVRFRVLKVAKKFQDAGKKVYFAVSNNNDFAGEVAEFGVDSRIGDKPVIVAKDAKDLKYVMEADFRSVAIVEIRDLNLSLKVYY